MAKKSRPAVKKSRRVLEKAPRSVRKAATPRRTRAAQHQVVRKKRPVKRAVRHRGGGRYAAVVAYAYAQIGARYRYGGAGSAFDCSELTMRAYARAGIRLPHNSRAQAARAYAIPRSSARPGDLVVGPGHVGIYVGRGWMIDAGNPRVGVSKRRLYRGLHIERF